MAVANHIREHGIDLGHLLQEDARLRFLLPVRNPLDCAASNLKTAHVSRFRGLEAQASIERVMLAILDEFRWFLELQDRHPDRFFCFFEHEFGGGTLRDMAQFLEIEADERWRENAIEVFQTQGSYHHSEKLCEFYGNAVRERFSGHPDFASKLLVFLEDRPERTPL